jgi:hypothetical protein
VAEYDFTSWEDMRGDSMILFGLRMVRLMDMNGEYHWHYASQGEISNVDLVGILEQTKFAVLSNMMQADEDDD